MEPAPLPPLPPLSESDKEFTAWFEGQHAGGSLGKPAAVWTPTTGTLAVFEDPTPIQEFDEVGRGYWLCPDLDKHGTSAGGVHPEVRVPATKDGANLISSLCSDGKQRPLLDLDVPARYVPSTTPGHGHLYIDVACSWDKYAAMLLAMADAGVLEAGYVAAALDRGATFLRPEWVKKPAEPEEVSPGDKLAGLDPATPSPSCCGFSL